MTAIMLNTESVQVKLDGQMFSGDGQCLSEVPGASSVAFIGG